MEQIYKAFKDYNVALLFTSSDYYSPYVGVAIESIIEHSRQEYNYDILIFETDIESSIKQKVLSLIDSHNNVCIRFINISETMDSYTFKTLSKNHAKYNFYRLAALDILGNYSKIIYMDSDIVVNGDIAELFFFDVENNYLAATRCTRMLAHCNNPNPIGKMKVPMREYLEKELGLKTYLNYFNSGVMLWNLEEMRKQFTSQQLLSMSESGVFPTVEQDVLNKLCEGKVKYISPEWNLLCFSQKGIEKDIPEPYKSEYYSSRDKAKIWHYCGNSLPCKFPDVDHFWYFWNYAKNTPFCDLLLERQKEEKEKKSVYTEKIGATDRNERSLSKTKEPSLTQTQKSVGQLTISEKPSVQQTTNRELEEELYSSKKETAGGHIYNFLKRIMRAILPSYRVAVRNECHLAELRSQENLMQCTQSELMRIVQMQQKALVDLKNQCYSLQKQNPEINSQISQIQSTAQTQPTILTKSRWGKNTMTSEYNLSLSCLAMEIHETHRNSFSEFRNCHTGQDVVIVATGPTMRYYNQLDGLPHIGMNAAYKNPNIHLDFYFVTDFENRVDEFRDLKDYNFIKFFGQYSPGTYRDRFQASEKMILENNGRRFFQGAPSEDIPLNIEYYPMMGFYTISFQAIQFALYTNARRIFLVGCDCSNDGYFDGRKENKGILPKWAKGYQKLKEFVEHFYPETEIISVNPVGLKGLYRDVYTENYLTDHPELDRTQCEILEEDLIFA